MSEIATWLAELGLDKYIETFAENDIDIDVLPELTEDHFKELGISLGHRVKLLKAISALPSQQLQDSSPSDAPAPVSPVTATAERRQLTVMFVDLVGSTALSEQLDPEDLSEIIRRYQDCCAGVISRFSGYIARFMGDGILVYFGYPQAHEDEVERAVRAGLAIVSAIATLKTRADLVLQVRIGVATGMVVVGEVVGSGSAQEHTVVGETPNLAARLQALAAPGQLVIAESSRRLIGNLFELTELGAQTLKGLSTPVKAYVVKGVHILESRFEARHTAQTPFIGREAELALLLDRWQRAKDAEGQIVLLSGEAGIGKSSLIRALCATIVNQSHIRFLYQCSPHHIHSAFYPIIQQLERAAKFVSHDNPVERLDKLERLLQQTGIVDHQSIQLFAALLSLDTQHRYPLLQLDPQTRKQRTLNTLADHLIRLSQQQPILLILEDAHWIDPTTQEMISLVCDRIQRAPVLIVATCRPEFNSPWANSSYHTVLELNRLSRQQVITLVSKIAADKAVPDEILERIISKTDGVPLFIEELTKTVLASHLLQERDDRYVLDKPLQPLAIPDTLRDSLLARLDRYNEAKEIAQLGAVIGRDFSYKLLAAISEQTDHDLQIRLQQLIDADLILARSHPPDANYTFKHALIQDAAYESLLRKRRQSLHLAIAKVLEHQDEAKVQTPETIARHLNEGGDVEKAIRYWGLAGDNALARSAQPEAAAHYEHALQLLSALETRHSQRDNELSLLLRLGQAQFGALGGATEKTIATYQHAVELALDCGDLNALCLAYYGQWVGTVIAGNIRQGLDIAQQIYRLDADRKEPWMDVIACRLSGTSDYLMGQLESAREALTKVLTSQAALALTQAPAGFAHNPLFTTSSTLAIVEWSLGYPDAALARSERNIARIDEQSNDPNTLSYALSWHLFLSLFIRNPNSVKRTADRLRDHTNASGGAFWAHFVQWGYGWVDLITGNAQHGLPLLREGIRSYMATGALQHVPLGKLLEAEAYMQLGNYAQCLSVLQQGEAIVTKTEQGFFVPEIHRRRGAALNAIGEIEHAEKNFLKALSIAKQQNSRSWELRSATSLARLRRDQGNRQKARDLLTPVYDWFSEGFDTADLEDAKALLDELA